MNDTDKIILEFATALDKLINHAKYLDLESTQEPEPQERERENVKPKTKPEPKASTSITIDQVQKALATFAQKKSPKEAKEILFNFDVKTLKDLAKEDYPVIMEQLKV